MSGTLRGFAVPQERRTESLAGSEGGMPVQAERPAPAPPPARVPNAARVAVHALSHPSDSGALAWESELVHRVPDWPSLDSWCGAPSWGSAVCSVDGRRRKAMIGGRMDGGGDLNVRLSACLPYRGPRWCRVVPMSTRMSITIPDELHADLTRLADASHISLASTVRAILSDVVPRMASVLDYIGTAPTISEDEVGEANAWLVDLQKLYDRAPQTYRDAIGDRPNFDPPPARS